MNPKWLLAALAGLFFVTAAFYSFVTPAWEAPDEAGHFAYVLHLRRTGALPIQKVDGVDAAHHVPLYYLLASAATLPVPVADLTTTFATNFHFMWHGHGNDVNLVIHTDAERFPFGPAARFLHLARLASVAMATATIIFIVFTGWEIFPEWPTIGLLAGALTAFNPQFLFISGAINNDNLLALACTGVIWQMMRTLRRMEAWRNWLQLGLWLTVGALAKISGLVLLGWTGIILAADAFYRRSWRSFWQRLLAMVAPIAVGTSWWFIRNQQLYGDPLGWKTYRSLFMNNARVTPLTLADLQNFFTTQFRTFWGYFGWMNVPAPEWLYVGALLLCVGGLIGLLAYLALRFGSLPKRQKAALASLGLLIVLYESYMLWSIRTFDGSWYQGRYLFGLMAAFSILLSLGLHSLFAFRRPRLLAAVVAASMFAVALYIPVFVIGPAY